MHRPAPPRRQLDGLAADDVERDGSRVDLDKRSAVELVERLDLAGLGHRVPLVLQPARVEHQREVVVGQFTRIHVRPGVKHRAPRRGRKRQPRHMAALVDEQFLADTVVEVADRVSVVVIRRARPLQRGLPQPLVAGAAQVVAGLRIPEPTYLVEDLLAGLVAEVLLEAHARGDLADQLPVGPRLTGRWDGLLQQRQVALGVDHDGVGFGPQRGRQHDVRVVVGRGGAVGVLGDDELGCLQAGDNGLPIGHGGNGIGADDPACLDRAVGELLEHVDGSGADV